MNRGTHAISNLKELPAIGAGTAVSERRILILAPTGNDARLTADFLVKSGLFPQPCQDVQSLCDEIAQGCGVIVLAEETLGDSSIPDLIQTLAKQPSWSDIPLVLITSGGEASQTRLRRLALFGSGGNVILLERPFRPGTLTSTLEVALRARQRQYEARDSVNKLKRAHDEIQAASRAKDDFLAALSHELRTPLNPVLLIASDNSGNLEIPPKIRADFETIRKNVELEARLIDDLLDLTRISRGKLSLDKHPADLHDILRDAHATIADDIKQKRIEVTMDFSADEHIVLGDAVRLQQVFWNILKNAVKFTPAGGRITVQTRNLPNKEKIAVRIADSGIGMTPKEIAHIFNAFSQGDHAVGGGPHRFGGLGLGLAITRMLVKLHSGIIFATSAGRDKGATFTVELFHIKTVAGENHVANPGKPLNKPGTVPENKTGMAILLVEDHEPTRIALAHLLARRKHKVMTAASVAEARAVAQKNKFDLVVSDIGLPDGDGYTLMSELRNDFGLKGIALSGYGMEQDVAKSKESGFVAHLIKPVRIESLEKTLADVV
ncbi:MAG TPA: ATP-binding protein [Verrucomicrobiae bacterium]|nr:ATP-binding protein [Verrucomicrobiae bacterium]